ncbi:MAG: carbon-nitrogen hydrolase family protein [Bacteroidales bacterium]|nr:carbon-nitrogen hydrolase family protein [Bacteroidales bacterium]
MNNTWRIAGVQMDVKLGQRAENLARIRGKLAEAAENGARLIAFPECALTGYCWNSREEIAQVAEPADGPSLAALAEDCKRWNVFAVVGMIESAQEKLFNAAALIGPAGVMAIYRKTHLPCLGADRFVDAGREPFVVHDLGGLKIGINICFDASFPEVARIFTLLGADLVVLPTNWADNARKMATWVPRVRALENSIYYLAVNRVGWEGGYHFMGHGSICHCNGDYLHNADHDQEVIFYADIEPEAARRKKLVHCIGEYEIDRVNWRRPDLYGPLTAPMPQPFWEHFQK